MRECLSRAEVAQPTVQGQYLLLRSLENLFSKANRPGAAGKVHF
jgi:hypothetical protein